MRRRLLAGAAFALLIFPATGMLRAGGRPSPHRPAARATAPPRPGSPPRASRSRRARSSPAPRRASATASTARSAARGCASSSFPPAPAARPRASAWAGSTPATRSRGRGRRRRACWRPATTSRACTPSAATAARCAAPRPPRALAPDRRRAASAAGAAPAVAIGSGVFPVRGAYTWGDPFGAPRGAATHRGQDLLTPRARRSPRRARASWPGAPTRRPAPATTSSSMPTTGATSCSCTCRPARSRLPRTPLTAGQVFARAGSTGHADGAAPALRDLARRLVRLGRLAADRPRAGPARVGRHRLTSRSAIARSTSSRDARRAGKIAATTPTMIANSISETIWPIGSEHGSLRPRSPGSRRTRRTGRARVRAARRTPR